MWDLSARGGNIRSDDFELPAVEPNHAVLLRPTPEQWIKEAKQAVKIDPALLSRFRSDEVRLALSLLAYNLGNLWRRLALLRLVRIVRRQGRSRW